MPPKLPTIAATFFDSIQLAAAPRAAADWLTELCVSNRWLGDEGAAREWAEGLQRRFLDELRKQHNDLTSLGRFVPFAFNSSSEYMLQGAAFIEPADSEAVRGAKQRRARLSAYVIALEELAPLRFEALCAGVLGLLNVKRPMLTSRSSDEGIDFYGRLDIGTSIFPNDPYPTIQKQLSVWMVGQAKRYLTMQVSTPDIRELVGSIELARARAFGGQGEKYADLKLRLCDPIFYLFFTTGRISGDGWRLLERSGVVAMDGAMLASFFADREVGVFEGAFDDGSFQDWIRQYEP